MNENDEAKELLHRAYSAHLKTAAALLYAWKANLTPEQLADLAQSEHDGEHLGVAVSAPGDRLTVQIFVLGAGNKTRVLQAIEQPTGSLTVN